MMSYQQTIAFLYDRLPMFSRIGAAAYKKDLHNTIELLKVLNNPHRQIKTIHVAGTNGKGSTSHILAAIMQANGYKTGLYTSPHLQNFRERIKINGQMIGEQEVIDFTEKIKPTIELIEPSFFEVTVAMAFEYFANTNVDIAIIETGLGGTLDSTNVIMPELSVITNIGWDHMNILGDTLEKIAMQKAGIIKTGVPVVIGETLPQTQTIFVEKAAALNAPIIFAQNEWIIEKTELLQDMLTVWLKKQNETQQVTTDLPGIYQQYNLRTVMTLLPILQKQGWQLTDEKIRFAFANVKKLTGLRGRWEILNKAPYLVLDVAHNEDGINQVLQQIKALQQTNNKLQISMIMGMVKDKDVDKLLCLLPANYTYYFTNAHMPRALSANELQAKALAVGLLGKCYDDVNAAIKDALQKANANSLIVVCGSVFVVGEVNIET